MDKELFVDIGVAAFGDSWQSQIQRYLKINNRQRITQWLKGSRPIPDLEDELLLLLEKRRNEIEKAIKLLKE